MPWFDIYIQIMEKCILNGSLWSDYKQRSFGIINTYIQRKQINRHDKKLLCELLCITDDYADNSIESATLNYNNFKYVADLYRNNKPYSDEITLSAVKSAFDKHRR